MRCSVEKEWKVVMGGVTWQLIKYKLRTGTGRTKGVTGGICGMLATAINIYGCHHTHVITCHQ